MKIAYLHGLESKIDPNSPKIKFLHNNFKGVYTPSINYNDTSAFDNIYNSIKSMRPDILVGSSMGGYFAYLIGSKLKINTILFNPAVIDRSVEPIVDNNNLKRTIHTILLGSTDNVINGNKVKSFFKSNGVGTFEYMTYYSGHHVPNDIFINFIKKITGLNEINKTNYN